MLIKIQTEYFNVMIIMIFFILSKFLDFKKKAVEKKLISLLKNLFLIKSLIFAFSIFSIILMIQISVFLKTFFSDFSKFLFLILIFSDFFDVMSTDFLTFLISQNM